MTKDSPDTVIKIHFHPSDTARDVHEKFNAAVASAKDEMEDSNVDDAAFCAFVRKRRAEEIKDGEVVERKYMDLRFNLDERICDGFYYASLIKYFLRLLTHPEVLDQPPETIEQDIP